MEAPSRASRTSKSRTALITATQELLAERGAPGNFSVQDVLERADVVVQTLYNHFPSKESLVTAAAAAANADIDQYLREICAAMDTRKIEYWLMRARLYGRIPDTHPTIAKVIAATTQSLEGRQNGYFAPAQGAVTLGAGDEPTLRQQMFLLTSSAALDRLIQLRLADTTLGVESVDELCVTLAMAFGMSESQAEVLVRLPLPSGH